MCKHLEKTQDRANVPGLQVTSDVELPFRSPEDGIELPLEVSKNNSRQNRRSRPFEKAQDRTNTIDLRIISGVKLPLQIS